LKPFLKWAGNKFKSIERIKSMLPEGKRLIEPFAGTGAVFLNTDYDEYLITDNNEDLIYLFKTLQNQKDDFIEYARSFFTSENNTEEKFYELRELFNKATDKRLKSALFLYLNRHCYNGLCRYNKKGEFNTPFGKYTKPYFPAEEMKYFYEKAQRAVFEVADFEEVMLSAKNGDVIYCDPPYVPLSPTASFTSYSTDGFGMKQQERLARVADLVSHRGIPVLISNHETDFTLKEYNRAQIEKFDVQRFISTKGSERNKAKEILALFH
jgi:DNA adenine methylase